MNKLLSQNTQDFKKNLDEIKQQKIKVNADEKNSTNNKNENDRLNMILNVIDRVYQFFEYKFLPDKQPVKLDTKPLPDENKSDLKQTMQLKQLQLNEIQKPLWIKLLKEDFSSLIKDFANNLDDENYKTTVVGQNMI